MLSITRRLEFDAGHRLLKHEGKCRNYHGHRYVVELMLQASGVLGEDGMVRDFGIIKKDMGSWIDTFFDHGMILQKDDPMILFCTEHDVKCYELDDAPTAENIAAELYRQAQLMFGPALDVMRVRLYETPNCWADYSE